MSQIVQFVVQAGIVAKTVLFFLLILSIVSWAIIIEKARLFRKVRKEADKFLKLFNTRPGWTDLYMYTRDSKNSPFSRIVKTFYNEIRSWGENNGNNGGQAAVLTGTQVAVRDARTSLVRSLELAAADEVAELEKRMILLSTTVSVSPFLGLLGTVWGIMSAFLSIGVTGSADIASVGPGIAEALITTVAGLAVAIPALIGYNYFVDQIRRLEGKLENFYVDLIKLMEREKPE